MTSGHRSTYPFTKEYEEKGYTISDIANIFQVSERQVSNIAANPRPYHWATLRNLRVKIKQEKNDDRNL